MRMSMRSLLGLMNTPSDEPLSLSQTLTHSLILSPSLTLEPPYLFVLCHFKFFFFQFYIKTSTLTA